MYRVNQPQERCCLLPYLTKLDIELTTVNMSSLSLSLSKQAIPAAVLQKPANRTLPPNPTYHPSTTHSLHNLQQTTNDTNPPPVVWAVCDFKEAKFMIHCSLWSEATHMHTHTRTCMDQKKGEATSKNLSSQYFTVRSTTVMFTHSIPEKLENYISPLSFINGGTHHQFTACCTTVIIATQPSIQERTLKQVLVS